MSNTSLSQNLISMNFLTVSAAFDEAQHLWGAELKTHTYAKPRFEGENLRSEENKAHIWKKIENRFEENPDLRISSGYGAFVWVWEGIGRNSLCLRAMVVRLCQFHRTGRYTPAGKKKSHSFIILLIYVTVNSNALWWISF